MQLKGYLDSFLKNSEGTGYEEWSYYLAWLNNQKKILQECLKKLRENYSYASIFPVIREVYENFWFINLAMNGIKHYKYFKLRRIIINTHYFFIWYFL